MKHNPAHSGFSVGAFAKMIGRAPVTLQRWDRAGQLKAFRTPSGRRFYTQEQLNEIKSIIPSTAPSRKTIVYCRVSSVSQKADLKRQVAAMEQFCCAKGMAVSQTLTDIGSGLNYQRKNFLAVTDAVVGGEVGELVIAHKDRLVRFGFEWIEHLCRVHGTKLTIVNATSLSPEAEMTQDLLSIVHGFSSRLHGLRKYKKNLEQALAENVQEGDA
jgi:predicted site-specific integrase-resolvase